MSQVKIGKILIDQVGKERPKEFKTGDRDLCFPLLLQTRRFCRSIGYPRLAIWTRKNPSVKSQVCEGQEGSESIENPSGPTGRISICFRWSAMLTFSPWGIPRPWKSRLNICCTSFSYLFFSVNPRLHHQDTTYSWRFQSKGSFPSPHTFGFSPSKLFTCKQLKKGANWPNHIDVVRARKKEASYSGSVRLELVNWDQTTASCAFRGLCMCCMRSCPTTSRSVMCSWWTPSLPAATPWLLPLRLEWSGTVQGIWQRAISSPFPSHLPFCVLKGFIDAWGIHLKLSRCIWIKYLLGKTAGNRLALCNVDQLPSSSEKLLYASRRTSKSWGGACEASKRERGKDNPYHHHCSLQRTAGRRPSRLVFFNCFFLRSRSHSDLSFLTNRHAFLCTCASYAREIHSERSSTTLFERSQVSTSYNQKQMERL